MRSNKQVDSEIKQIAQALNSARDVGVRSTSADMAFAVYRALRWARGCREGSPADFLRDKLNNGRSEL